MNKRVLVFIILAGTSALVGCSSQKKETVHAAESAGRVSVFRVESIRLPSTQEVVGTVQAADRVQLAAQMMGTVTAVRVREGDTIRRGQVLATIDSAQPQASVQQAQAALSAAQHQLTAAETQKKLADSTLSRYQVLYERKSLSAQEFDEVKARAEAADAAVQSARAAEAQARAALAQAQTGFTYTQVRAPFDGVVLERRVDPGALAGPGTSLFTVESSGRFRLETNIDEASLRVVRIGQSVPITFDVYPDQQMTGKVAQIIPGADPSTRTFTVKIELPKSPLLRSGIFGRARFDEGERDVLAVPASAVVDRGSLKGVYVVGPDQVASLRYITLGSALGERYEVLSGLSPNEPVVLAPADRELGGRRVEVQ